MSMPVVDPSHLTVLLLLQMNASLELLNGELLLGVRVDTKETKLQERQTSFRRNTL